MTRRRTRARRHDGKAEAPDHVAYGSGARAGGGAAEGLGAGQDEPLDGCSAIRIQMTILGQILNKYLHV